MPAKNLFFSACCLSLLACGAQKPVIVPVPEWRFTADDHGAEDRPSHRAEEAEKISNEHVRLPLEDAAVRKKLEAFLCGGGDTRKSDNGVCSDDSAPRRYKPLLDLLGRRQPFTTDDFLNKPTFKGWFHGNAVFGVVDARLPSPAAFPPLAVSDGRYWWVFYTEDGATFNRFTVFLAAVPPRQARGKY